jgi:hypothetical protein
VTRVSQLVQARAVSRAWLVVSWESGAEKHCCDLAVSHELKAGVSLDYSMENLSLIGSFLGAYLQLDEALLCIPKAEIVCLLQGGALAEAVSHKNGIVWGLGESYQLDKISWQVSRWLVWVNLAMVVFRVPGVDNLFLGAEMGLEFVDGK